MIAGTLHRYIAWRFLGAVLAVFFGIYALISLIDYVELTKRTAHAPNVTAWLVAQCSFFRVPLHTEKIMPFAVLVGTMSCFLNMSRRLELVIARAAGMSAWQFVMPAVLMALLLGVFATTAYNPLSAMMQERSKRIEAHIFGEQPRSAGAVGSGFWARQRSGDTQSIINAQTSREQGVVLNGVTVLVFDNEGHFLHRIEAASAMLGPGNWRLSDARILATGALPIERATYLLPTSLTPEQVRESFATPETVPFWQIPAYIDLAERAGLVAVRYQLQYQLLLARPFLLAAMVLLAAGVSLRFFRFGGVQKMILFGVTAGFSLYVLSKITEDLSKAQLMHPVTAAWLPAFIGALTGLVVLLYQEDG
jgi:lipopolysaccharide export system permease protein